MWAIERKYVDPAEVDFGPLPKRHLNKAWFVFTALMWASLACMAATGLMPLFLVLSFAPIALIIGRMVAVDICYLLLLNIYTLPLTLVGIGYSVGLLGRTWSDALLGLAVGAVIGLVIDLGLHLIRRGQAELGFGDVKLLAALGAWVGLTNLPFALTVAFVANLLLSLVLPKNSAIPFGFGLGAGIWALSALELPFMMLLLRTMS